MTVKAKKGLGRGLSALIPDADMEFLSRVARGEVASASISGSSLASVPPESVPAAASAPPPQVRKAPFRGAPWPDAENPTLNSPPPTATPRPAKARVDTETEGVQRLALDLIEANPYQPRRTFHPQELEDLAASIREHGVLQPILLRPSQGAKPYQLVAGERRWRAARVAGLEQVPAIVRQVGDQQALELALIENVQRHDISPLDAAIAYKRLSSEFRLSQEKIALRVGKSRVAVANAVRLLDLPEEAQRALEDGTLSEGHGRAILIAPTEGSRRAVFRRIVRDRLSVRDAEHLARETTTSSEGTESAKAPDGLAGNASSPPKEAKNADGSASTDLKQAQDELQRRLGARLQVRPRARGGQIIIDYANMQDFERLFALLKGQS